MWHVNRFIESVALLVVLKEMWESEYTCEEEVFRMVTLVVFSKCVGSEDSRGTQELEAFQKWNRKIAWILNSVSGPYELHLLVKTILVGSDRTQIYIACWKGSACYLLESRVHWSNDRKTRVHLGLGKPETLECHRNLYFPFLVSIFCVVFVVVVPFHFCFFFCVCVFCFFFGLIFLTSPLACKILVPQPGIKIGPGQ